MKGDDSTRMGSTQPRERTGRSRWQTEFPYHWDADEVVGRRGLLQLAVLTSGALFAGTALLGLLGLIRRPQPVAPRPIVEADRVPEGGAFYFNYPNSDDQAILLHLPGEEFVAYRQKCTHLSCSVYWQTEQNRLHCPCHDGVFEARTGEPIAGPPQRPLERIVIRREGNMLIAVEEASG